jgi:hypothetical protein
MLRYELFPVDLELNRSGVFLVHFLFLSYQLESTMPPKNIFCPLVDKIVFGLTDIEGKAKNTADYQRLTKRSEVAIKNMVVFFDLAR